jgi:large subunit ribosomal protein L7e
MNVEKNKPKQPVPETVSKKRTRNSKLAESRKRFLANRKQRRQTRKEEHTKGAENHAKAHAKEEKDLVALRRKARTENSYYVPAESKIAIVVRIRGINHLAPHVRKILQLFRLRQIHNATFIRINRATLNMLKKVEPYVTFGYPTRKVISDMIYKRGYGKIDKQRIPLTSNEIVEKGLGRFGIRSVEDLIHHIDSCGPHFKQANNFLWSFKLNSPKGGFNNKRHPYQQGGDWGNREEEINALIRRML